MKTQTPNTVIKDGNNFLVTDHSGRAWSISLDSKKQMLRDAKACMESRRSNKSCGCLCCQLYQLNKKH